MKTILILGSTGFIGRNLKEWFEKKKQYTVLCPNRKELDLLDENMADSFLAAHKIDVVFNCAIFSPKSEMEELEVIEKDLRMFLNLEKNKDKFGKMFYFGSGADRKSVV